MKLLGLQLASMRLFQSWTHQFGELTLLQGANGSGKTTVLEAIHALATGKSFRASTIGELVSFTAEYGRIKGRVEDSLGESTLLELLLTRGELQGKKTNSVHYAVNDVKKRQKDFCTHLHTVVFLPEDMRLIEGSPFRRRNYIDAPLSILHPEYALSLKKYGEALVKRNKLLQKVRDGSMPRATLSYFTQQLLVHGSLLQKYRRSYVEFCNTQSFVVPLRVEYLCSVMSEERMFQYAQQEVAAGHTLIGPHKDDMMVRMPLGGEQRDIGLFGSRGQQRLAVVWLKLCEWHYLFEKLGKAPLLLLDDIFSELDENNSHLISELMHRSQTFVTTADLDLLPRLDSRKVEVIQCVTPDEKN